MSKSKHTEAEMVVALKELEAERKTEDVTVGWHYLDAILMHNDPMPGSRKEL